MTKYHKINTIYKRDSDKPKNPIILGDWSQPEFEYLANNIWTFTEKVDGTNIRIQWDGFKISIKGKTDKAQIPTFLLKAISETMFPLEAQFRDIFGHEQTEEGEPINACLYGEGYGNNIQKVGQLYSPINHFVLFDIKIGEWWLRRNDVEDIAKTLGLDIVPIVGEGTLYEGINLVKRGLKSQWGDFIAEGIIAKPKVELLNRGGSRIVTKIKYKDFIDLDATSSV